MAIEHLSLKQISGFTDELTCKESIFSMLVHRKIWKAHQLILQSQHNLARPNKGSKCLCTCVNTQTLDQFYV